MGPGPGPWPCPTGMEVNLRGALEVAEPELVEGPREMQSRDSCGSSSVS